MAGKRATGARTFVLEYFHRHVGEEVWITDLASESGFTTQQLQNCISGVIRNEPNCGIESMVRGRSWRYLPPEQRPEAVNGKRIFEEMAASKTGQIVIQDDEGNLFIATPL